MARLRLRTSVTIPLLLSLLEGTGCFEAVRSQTPAHRVPLGTGPRGTAQRAADRVIARRSAERSGPTPSSPWPPRLVKVTSNRGVVRLVGRVRTGKERSSMAFEVGQIAGLGRIDDRVTVGNGVEGTVQ